MDILNFELSHSLENKFALVIGVGGGGCNALDYIYTENLPKSVDYFAINTDIQALNALKVPLNNRLLIGEKLTKGLGAGADPSKGELSARESIPLLKKFISKDYKIVFILAGMGGGTGTGATPIIAKICKDLNILTIAILSTPYTFEGSLRQKQAKQGIELTTSHADAVLLFANDNILNLYSNLKFSEAFRYSDSIFKKPLDIILGIILETGYINVDFEDVRTVLNHSGLATVVSGMGEGENRIVSAINELIQSPFMSNINIHDVNNILLQIESGVEEVTMAEIGEITDFFQEKFGNNADLIWGNNINLSLNKNIRINAILSGIFEDQISEYTDPNEIEIEKNVPRIIEKEVDQIKREFKGKKIAFLIMQFGKGKLYSQLLNSLKSTLAIHNIVVLRADDKEYHENLYYNILSYIHASDFGIAVFERILDDNFNPNVAFEVGYMLGINKQVCHLKEKSLKHLHTDIMGRLYREFDIQDIENTLVPNLENWLSDKSFK